jgi:hypothetical protein
VVLDYSDPPGSLPEKARIRHETRAAYVAGLGEAWLTFFEAHTLRSRLMALGFSEVEDLGPQQIATRYSPERTRPVPDKGGHILRATTLKSG